MYFILLKFASISASLARMEEKLVSWFSEQCCFSYVKCWNGHFIQIPQFSHPGGNNSIFPLKYYEIGNLLASCGETAP